MNNNIKNIIFAGTPPIAAYTLERLIEHNIKISACYTRPDRPSGRGQKLTYSAVKHSCLNYNIPIFQPENFKVPIEQQKLQQLQPDLLIVFAYGLILPKIILELPTFGCINIHTSLLPKWRGAAPTQHAILAGNTITGITIIKMGLEVDSGPILYSASCSIDAADTNESLHQKLQPLAVNGVLEVLRQINVNQLTPQFQDNKLATYAKKIDKSMAKINWHLSAIEIDRIIRAFIPDPIAFTNLKGQEATTIKIWQATINKEINVNNNDPGKIIVINKHGINVSTGNGVLRLEKLQFPGGKILHVADLLNSTKYQQLFVSYVQFN